MQWIEEVYDRKSVKKTNVDLLFLQLVALEILVLEKKSNGMFRTFARGGDPTNRYSDTLCSVQNISWSGINSR